MVIAPAGVLIDRENGPKDVRTLNARNLTGGFFAPTDTGTDENSHGRQGVLAVSAHHVITLEAIP